VNAELLKNLFFNKAPLHDGAVIIRDGRIAAAGCVLPLTKSTNLSKDLGMRHRAGIGMSEQSDALVVIVSEETGAISVAVDGLLKRHLNSSTFEKILHSELVLDESESNKSIWKAIKKLLTVDKDEQEKQINEKNN
jgi:diadenylate cyclase